VAVVLVIAGANVVNLLLVRAESRTREVAVRAALGGTRGRIAGTFLAESTLLALAGGVLGSLLAAAGIQLLRAYGPAQLPRLHEISIDALSLIFAATLSLAVGVIVGMAPLSGLPRRSFAQVLRDGGRGNTAGPQRHLVRRILIVGQVAMALVLLVGSGLMLRSVSRLASVDPGFRAPGLLTAGVSIGNGSDRPRASTFYQRVLDELATLPGVTSVRASNSLPIEAGGMNGSSFAIQSRPRAESDIQPVTMYQAVTAGFFETLGVPLVDGRLPTKDDDTHGRHVAWVNEKFARDFLDGRALGERIQLEGNWLEIVGVVGDIRTFGLREEIRPVAYLPPTVPDADGFTGCDADRDSYLGSASVARLRASSGGRSGRQIRAAHAYSNHGRDRRVVVRAVVLHDDPDAHGVGPRARAWRDRSLWRDQLCGEPANGRNRRAACAGRAAGSGAGDGTAPGTEYGTSRSGRRSGRGDRGDQRLELAAV
jgi:predicted permease